MSARAASGEASARPGGTDPARALWNLLTNVKFAVVLVGSAASASMAGVLLPQVPPAARQSAAAEAAWVESKRESFGGLTDLFNTLGLFDVFHAWWFNAIWLVVIVAVTVCAVSRFRPTARSVQRPQRIVPDRYFETAHHRAAFAHPGGPEAMERALRARRYHVERVATEGRDTYLFAQRFAWSQYGTFVSHLALLMLLVGGLLTRFAGLDTTVVAAETEPALPVFDEPGPGQVFIEVLEAHRGLDQAGNVVDFRTALELRRGDETVLCQATVNDPCEAFGYRFHQAAWFDDFARMVITAPDGRVLFDDVLDFESRSTVGPVLRVTSGAGAVLFDQVLPQMATDPGPTDDRADDRAEATLVLASAQSAESVGYIVNWKAVGDEVELTLVGFDLAPVDLRVGQSARTGDGLTIEYTGWRLIPALTVLDMPGALGDSAVIQMPTDQQGNPYLFISGVDMAPLAALPGRPVQASTGYAYEFQGKVEGSGINIRKDPGDTFIWVAVGMAILGLSITFYVPRRRLWARVTPERTYLAGIADRNARFGREMRQLGAGLGSADALLPEDTEEP